MRARIQRGRDPSNGRRTDPSHITRMDWAITRRRATPWSAERVTFVTALAVLDLVMIVMLVTMH